MLRPPPRLDFEENKSSTLTCRFVLPIFFRQVQKRVFYVFSKLRILNLKISTQLSHVQLTNQGLLLYEPRGRKSRTCHLL
jgi:hypothetical protein